MDYDEIMKKNGMVPVKEEIIDFELLPGGRTFIDFLQRQHSNIIEKEDKLKYLQALHDKIIKFLDFCVEKDFITNWCEVFVSIDSDTGLLYIRAYYNLYESLN